ncbi:MAG TPA: DUF4249 domain-containing protein [Puia sp.]|uniref:DUF4249 domain-containing protein n=1 Tax=Puia sp. TaxID=2045100 RepID=UPI002CEB0F5F|nr:DUF4249 domain-containing protein [Puia sp.]HVU95534.1 DUF4249 domain-containing protein [Puia sp.]
MTYKCVLIAAAATIITSCQKVINLNLRTAPPKYIIEGNVTNLPGPYQVKISQTEAVNSTGAFNGVSHANVTIKDDAGNAETLQETQPGIYQTTALQGIEGQTYHLTITTGQNTFTATSTMPHSVNLDSLYTEQVYNFSKMVIAVVPLFTDPVGKGNNYRFNQTINGNLDKTLYGETDDFTDGKQSTWSLLRPDPDSTLHAGDRVDIEMQCIDRPNYDYWFSVDQASTGSSDGSQPGNPKTNIIGGALGYFSAHTSQTKTLVIPK